jgi:CheY-like chemotaxis protein
MPCCILSPVIPRLPRAGRAARGAKPRLLLVDDHQAVLDRMSALLADDFEVAGAASSGRHALELARQIDPDLIVLDINMPGFDGFQTSRALEQAGSRAPVVFLSMLDADEDVRQAFQCGGRGYVVKSRAARDLATALDQVLLGRVFVPSVSALPDVAERGGHALQLYDDIETFLDGLAAFFDRALRGGDAACVLATEDVRDGLRTRLRSRGWDVGGGHPRYIETDAADALRSFMGDRLPDADRLFEIAEELDRYRRAVTGSATSRLTIFGNMVRVLIADGNAEAAIALENLWTTVTRDRPFLTLCGYATSCFDNRASDLWARACAEHWAVSHTADL